MLRNEFKIAIRFTLLTAVVLGILYPLAVTGIGHLAFRHQAEGELIVVNGQVTGSRLIGQNFTGDQYFHGRPSAAGNGYDATSSGPSNYAAVESEADQPHRRRRGALCRGEQEPAGANRLSHRLRLWS